MFKLQARYIFFIFYLTNIFAIINSKVFETDNIESFKEFLESELDVNSLSFNINQQSDIISNNISSLDFNDDILEDSFLVVPQLITKYGYKSEIHTIETKDGYLLELHRIPNPGKQPVLLMHGLLDSSSTWVIMGPTKGLAYMLADLGYDVWMGNVRGNRYSKKHKVYDQKDSEFWKFSFHEMGKYDLPAIIDYIINSTSYKKIHYIGHSQGSAIFWILCHEHPEYNNKILSMQAFGPVAFVSHCKSPIVRIMTFFLNSITLFAKLIGWNEFLPSNEFVQILSEVFCKDGVITQIVCKNLIFLLAGYNPKQLNSTMIPVIGGHAPAGASSRQLMHFGQLVRSRTFRQFDYGWTKNLMVYGRMSPPEYDLSKTLVKVTLHYSLNDWLAAPKDVEKLRQKLPNVIGNFLVKDVNFNHLDFLWGIDVRKLLYKRVVKIMKLIEASEI